MHPRGDAREPVGGGRIFQYNCSAFGYRKCGAGYPEVEGVGGVPVEIARYFKMLSKPEIRAERRVDDAFFAALGFQKVRELFGRAYDIGAVAGKIPLENFPRGSVAERGEDTVSESSKAGSAFPARDFSAALILSKKSFLSIFFEPFSKFAAPEFGERAGFQPPAEWPDSKGVYRQEIRKPVEGDGGAPDFRRGRHGAPRLEADVVCDFQRLGFDEVAHFQNQVGEGDF